MISKLHPKNKKVLSVLIALLVLLMLVGLGGLWLQHSKLPFPKAVKQTSEQATEKPTMKDCLMSDWESKKRCDQLVGSITSFDECTGAGFAIEQTYPEKCSLPDGRTFSRVISGTALQGKVNPTLKIEYETVDLVGIVQDLGNLNCPCFILKLNNGKTQSVRYGLFLPDQNRKTVAVGGIKNGYQVRVIGVKEKNTNPGAFIEVLLDKIEIINTN